MFQLDGQITYPCDRAEGGATQASGTAAPEGSKSSCSITWEGWWHYSTKQPKSSSSHSSFKYVFVGPQITGRPPLLANDNSGSNKSSDSTTDQSGSDGQNSPRSTPGELVLNSKSQPAAQANGEAAVTEASTTTGMTSSGTSGRRNEHPSRQGDPSNTTSASSSPDHPGYDAVGNGNALPVGAAGDTQAPEKPPVDMSLYGPGGDGRLPSGTWSGQFAVKNGRGGDIMVSESFMLEFGSGKTPKPQPCSTVTSETRSVSSSPAEAPRSHPPTSSTEKDAPVTGQTTTATAVVNPAEAEKRATSTAVESGSNVVDQAGTGSTRIAGEATKAAVSVSNAAGATPAPEAAVESVSVAPVVRVSGWGHNRYGEFTLTGGHERATGRLDLTRIYLNTQKTSTGSGPQAARSEGTTNSQQKRRRPLPPGATPPPPPGPSLAERRTKRTRCPNQRLFDDEAVSHGHMEGTGGSSGLGRRKSSSDIGAASSNVLVDAGSSGLTLAGGGGLEAGSSNETPRRGTPGAKPRKPRDRSRDLMMEQSRRARKRAHQVHLQDAMPRGGAESAGDAKSVAPPQSTAEAAAAELAERARAGREALAGADLASLIGANSEDDQFVKEAIANMEKEQAGLEAAAAAAAAAAAVSAAAAEAESDAEVGVQATGVIATVAAQTAEVHRAESNGVASGSTRGSKRSRSVQEERWRSISLDEETGEVYEGEVFRGKRHGQGLCVYANKNIYEGDWRFGKEHGMGQIMRSSRELIYMGEFVDGKLCGKGRFVDESGDVYDGDWKDSLRHGYGIYTFAGDKTACVGPDGEPKSLTTYKGDFKDNLRCGRGVMTWHGGRYDGEWLNDAKHGRGVLTTDNGFVYDGCWVDDLPEGRGICVHPDGQRYLGIFKGGKKEGRGTLDFSNGASYEGRFRDDAIDGQGMLRIPEVVQDEMGGWMIPIEFQSDIERIHQRSGFDVCGT